MACFYGIKETGELGPIHYAGRKAKHGKRLVRFWDIWIFGSFSFYFIYIPPRCRHCLFRIGEASLRSIASYHTLNGHLLKHMFKLKHLT